MHLAWAGTGKRLRATPPRVSRAGRSRGARSVNKRTKSAGPFIARRASRAHRLSARRACSHPENNDRSANAPSLRANAPARASTSERRGLRLNRCGSRCRDRGTARRAARLIRAERAERRHVLERPFPSGAITNSGGNRSARSSSPKHGGQEPRALLVRPQHERGDAARGRNRRCGIARALPGVRSRSTSSSVSSRSTAVKPDAVAMTREGVAAMACRPPSPRNRGRAADRARPDNSSARSGSRAAAHRL